MTPALTIERGRSRGAAIGKPPSPPEDDGGGSAWVKLIAAANDIDAHLVGGRLAESGVECRFVKDTTDLAAWLYGGANPWAPVTVMVRRLDLDAARQVLAQIALDEAAPLGDADEGDAYD